MIQDSRARMGPTSALVGSPVGSFAPAVATDERTIDLAGLITILRRRLKLIAIAIACVLALAVSYILFTTPTYMADARILVDPRKKHTVGTEVVPSGLGENFAESFALVDSQVKMILSDAVLRPVVKSQHLAADPEFGAPREPNVVMGLWQAFTGLLSSAPPAESDNPEERALTTLVKHMKVSRDDQTFVIEIDVTTEDPAKSARLAQAIAESYLADQSNDKAETTQRVSALMDGQLATLRQRLSTAENAVETFRAAHNHQEADGELIDTHQLKGLNDQMISAENDLAQAETKYNQVDQLLKNGVDPSMIGDVIASDTIARLREQYALAARKEATLSVNLLPSHPQLQAAHSEVQRLHDLIRDEVKRVADAIKLQYEVAKQRMATAEQALATSRQEADTNDSARVKLRELERDARTTRSVYESFLSRVKEMNEAELIYTPDARIISPAAIPDRASWPRKSLILALALVLGCGLGGSLALTAEHLDRRIYTGAQLLAATGLKSLASIPSLHGKRDLLSEMLGRRPARANFYDMVMEILDGGTGFRAAVLRLLTRLVNFDTFGQPRVVLLTSSVEGEGKSALALSLAVAGASTGMRVLLVDASTADPTLSQLIGEPAAGSRLSDRLITDQRLGLSFLSLVAPRAGKSGRPALAEELGQICAGFDLTLVDAGLLRSERNAPALITIAQAILFLARASATSQDAAAAAALDLLQMANGKRCAAVLTMTGDGLER
jgi:succinoglycan biosynthesis transport protein ExoP